MKSLPYVALVAIAVCLTSVMGYSAVVLITSGNKGGIFVGGLLLITVLFYTVVPLYSYYKETRG